MSNPTQNGAARAARFLTATNEADALAELTPDRARYVIVDWELPFREGPDQSLAGRFQNLADWAGIPTSRFYSQCFARKTDVDPWEPVWIYREPYYQSMVYRLMVLGGAPAAPVNSTYVAQIVERTGAEPAFLRGRERRRYRFPDAKAAALNGRSGFKPSG